MFSSMARLRRRRTPPAPGRALSLMAKLLLGRMRGAISATPVYARRGRSCSMAEREDRRQEACPMRLYLVQHGEAVPEQVDPQRPLSEAGRRDVQAMARLLAGAGIRPTRIVHSGKRRAQETAELLA